MTSKDKEVLETVFNETIHRSMIETLNVCIGVVEDCVTIDEALVRIKCIKINKLEVIQKGEVVL